MPNIHHDFAERVQALTLMTYGIPIEQVATIVSISRSQLYKIKKHAFDRGFQPTVSPIILDVYVTYAARNERPPKVTKEIEEHLIRLVTRDRNGREKTSRQLASELGLSATTIWRILRRLGFRKCKLTKKPGLTLV